MTRTLLALGLLVSASMDLAPCHAQGIRGVTRRTTTLEFQAPARQFFDAAGLPVTGGGAVGSGAVLSGGAQAGIPARPVARPMLATRPPTRQPMPMRAGGIAGAQVGVARPYILGPVSRPAQVRSPQIVAAPTPQPARRHVPAVP